MLITTAVFAVWTVGMLLAVLSRHEDFLIDPFGSAVLCAAWPLLVVAGLTAHGVFLIHSFIRRRR